MMNRRGTAYIEYFLLAAAMALATVTVWGNLGTIRDSIYAPRFQCQMNQIAGMVVNCP